MQDKYKNPSHIIHKRGYVYNFHFHLVWVTKFCCPIFTTPKLVHDMKLLLKQTANYKDITIEKMKVMPDHVHLLLSFKPKYSPTNVVRFLKGRSARMFLESHPKLQREKVWNRHLWSRSYYMGTVGDMSRKTVIQYIKNQYKNSPYPNLDKGEQN